MLRGKPNKKYDEKFKVQVVETMEREGLSLHEAARQFRVSNRSVVAR